MTMDETSQKIHAALGTPEGVDEEAAPRTTILRAWSEVLSNIESSAAEPISMGVAAKVVASWPQMTFQEAPLYHARYHDLLLDIRALLTETINDHPGCANVPAEDDLTENHELYKALVIAWNIRLDELEQQWRAEHEHSHIEFAALVDVRAFLFSRNGFAGHLEAVGYTLDSDEVFEAIKEARGDQ